MTLEWHYPVWKPTTPERGAGDGQTVTTEYRRKLPREEAFSLVADDDRRPLLVMRECNRCKGSDDALLSRTMDNEKTVLLAHYFRCVKLPVHVLEDDHPFRALFADEHPAHLFLADPGGVNLVPLEGNQTQGDLWKSMERVIDEHYDGSVKNVLRELQKVFAQYDNVDSLEDEVRQRLNREIERRGPDSPKVAKMQKRIEELQAQRKKWIEREAEVRASIVLKEPEEAPGAGDPEGDRSGGGNDVGDGAGEERKAG